MTGLTSVQETVKGNFPVNGVTGAGLGVGKGMQLLRTRDAFVYPEGTGAT